MEITIEQATHAMLSTFPYRKLSPDVLVKFAKYHVDHPMHDTMEKFDIATTQTYYKWRRLAIIANEITK